MVLSVILIAPSPIIVCNPEKNNQIIKFDSFDSFDCFEFEKISTHRQTDQQTFGLIEATSRRLKN